MTVSVEKLLQDHIAARIREIGECGECGMSAEDALAVGGCHLVTWATEKLELRMYFVCGQCVLKQGEE